MTRRQLATWQVTQGDLVRYAGAARDFNDIHYDPRAAQAAGFAGPIAHGMLTLGRLLALVVEEHGLAWLGNVSCRFTGPAVVGSTLSFAIEDLAQEGLAATVADEAGRPVLTARIDGGRPAPVAVEGLDPVADRALVVERGPAARFAETVGSRAAVFHDPQHAAAIGYAALPTFPTYAFALPGWGWFRDTPGNAGDAAPDAVADCARWAQTTAAVVHAGQRFSFHRPLYVGEQVRARTYLTDRSTKVGTRSTLRFTEVTTVLTDRHDTTVLISAMSLVVQDPITQEER
jgi:acyl dehydratase